jgi:hypothetical protein
MKILDRSIAFQFTANAAVLFLILAGVITAVDYAFNFDEYFRIADRVYENSPLVVRAAGSILVLLNLWWPRLFVLYDFLLGFVLVGAMGFTLTQMVRHRELVAILASGQSMFRVARPMVLVALLMVVLQGLNREMIIPRLAPLLTRDKGDAGSSSMGAVNRVLHVDGRGRVFYARSFSPRASPPPRPSGMERSGSSPAARWKTGVWALATRVRSHWPRSPATSIPPRSACATSRGTPPTSRSDNSPNSSAAHAPAH